MIAALALLASSMSSQVETFTVNGVARVATVVAPTSETIPAPLVFVFHGHGGNMHQAQLSFAIDKVWPEAVVVYPQGLPTKGKTDPEGKKAGWQQSARDSEGRDLAFFDVMLATIKKEHKIDPKRVYVTGHSNGGRFTYLLWAERGEAFAAVAPSASPAIGLIRKFRPLPAFVIAGEKDQLVPFRSQKFSIDAIRFLLKTDSAKAKVDGYTRLEPGPNGIELGTYIFPGPHTFPPEARSKVVEFFRRHHR
ncbi:MAG: alpha/beta hydrolase family esterase [Fimbriimonadales bacterium]